MSMLKEIRDRMQDVKKQGVTPRVLLMTSSQREKLQRELADQMKIPLPLAAIWQVYGLLIITKDKELIDFRV